MLIKGLLLALCILRWSLEHFAHLHTMYIEVPVPSQGSTKILVVNFGIVPKVWCVFF